MINPMSNLAQLSLAAGTEGGLRSELEFLVLQNAIAQANRGRASLRLETEQLMRLIRNGPPCGQPAW